MFPAVIALLLIREFTIQVQLTQLRSKVTVLTQEIALRENGTTPQEMIANAANIPKAGLSMKTPLPKYP